MDKAINYLLIFGLLILCYIIATIIAIIIVSCKKPKPTAHTLVILGCKIKGNKPTKSLKRRLDSAYSFLEKNENIVFLGPSGVGKTHLATAIGIEAASQRISTYFINFAQLMEKFKRAAKENRVEQVVKHYLKYTVLIIDEIGYLPVDKAAAYGFFQLIAARYEFRPTILTTNQSFSKWPDVFGDAVIANAIIDRLVHHCEIIKITGHSYRVKDRNLFDEDAEVKL